MQSLSLKPEQKPSPRTGVLIRSICKVMAMAEWRAWTDAGVRARAETQSPDGGWPWGHLTTLAHTVQPSSSWPQLCASTLQLHPGAQADKSSWSWVLTQGPMSLTGKHSGLWIVFGEFDPSRPTSLTDLLTSHHSYHLFHWLFLIFASISIS